MTDLAGLGRIGFDAMQRLIDNDGEAALVTKWA